MYHDCYWWLSPLWQRTDKRYHFLIILIIYSIWSQLTFNSRWQPKFKDYVGAQLRTLKVRQNSISVVLFCLCYLSTSNCIGRMGLPHVHIKRNAMARAMNFWHVNIWKWDYILYSIRVVCWCKFFLCSDFAILHHAFHSAACTSQSVLNLLYAHWSVNLTTNRYIWNWNRWLAMAAKRTCHRSCHGMSVPLQQTPVDAAAL